MNSKIIYDGSLFCGEDDCDCGCPVIEFEQSKNMVSIYDPNKPDNGKYYMTVSEYNALIKNAKPV
jgi:hypothetical protein